MKNTTLPESATRGWVVLAGFLTFMITILALKHYQVQDRTIAAMISIGATVVVLAVLDIFVVKVHRRESTGLDWSKNDPSISRTLTKFIGLLGSIGFIAFLYWLFPEYHGSFYDSFYEFFWMILPWWLVLSLPYIYILDSKQKSPRDSYYQMGSLVMLKFDKVNFAEIWQHLLGWLVKGFFLPLMFTYLGNDISKFIAFDFSTIVDFKTFFDFTFDNLFLFDVGIVSMGYIMSLKLLDSHLRSTEPTMRGWLVAVICYQPFWSLVGKQYIDYVSPKGWGYWFSDSPTLYALWGSMILILYGIYLWASVMFGLRFSNLTHRGILTNGPYRYTKHPAYVSKNIAWWFTSVPFLVSESLAETIRRCFLVLLINFVYYLRAKTEEDHLGRDPIYVQYSKWIDEHGLFRWLKW
ncbi:MAG: membrane protein [Oligoflexia bacterium]|nr:MAG: membrane protein [Oligoflexia bacterium]